MCTSLCTEAEVGGFTRQRGARKNVVLRFIESRVGLRVLRWPRDVPWVGHSGGNKLKGTEWVVK